MTKTKTRNTSLELLRVVSMFMILTVHFLGWGGAVNSLTISNINFFGNVALIYITEW